MFRAKDFIETAEGLLFAVVADGEENGKILCFLRYLCVGGRWQKVATDVANAHLAQHCPDYLHHSPVLDARLHGVARDRIVKHYRPRPVLQQLLAQTSPDAVVTDLQRLCGLLADSGLDLSDAGITGSLLIGMQNRASDIDLVFYDRDSFHRARSLVQSMIAQNHCQALSDEDWLNTYQRRACDFALDEYIWHEERKYNKAMINQRKFDLSLVAPATTGAQGSRKLGLVKIETRVTNDYYGFDYPARFAIDHPEIAEVVCFTATYTGQAQSGEWVAVAGQLEIDAGGARRIVVGSNREAIGEYIRVLR